MDNKYLNYKFQVSAFCDVWDVNNNNQNKNYDAEFILDIIRTGNKGVANKINAIRKATTKEERDKLKQHLQTVMWQGIFAERNNNSCLSLSGLVCIDVDHVDEHELDRIKQTLSGWSCVLAFFMSPSGDGLKVIIKTDNNSIVGILYDSNNRLIKRYDYNGASLTISELNDGAYTLVTMAPSGTRVTAWEEVSG